MPATRKNRLYKKMKRRGKKNSYKSKRKTMHKRKSGKNRSRRHRGGNLLWPAYGAPANGVSPVNIKIPEMAYNIKGGNTNAVNPFVGKAWGAPIQDWPGVSGPHDGNHYAMNLTANKIIARHMEPWKAIEPKSRPRAHQQMIT
jgi:hypothetical protein